MRGATLIEANGTSRDFIGTHKEIISWVRGNIETEAVEIARFKIGGVMRFGYILSRFKHSDTLNEKATKFWRDAVEISYMEEDVLKGRVAILYPAKGEK